jgi:DNA-binding Lrp family transcriptional regulator
MPMRDETDRRLITVRLSEAYAPETIRAVMMVEVEGSSTRSVIWALRGMPEIVELHTTNGAWDLVAEISVATLPEFDRLLREVRETPGVLNSETSLLLDTV